MISSLPELTVFFFFSSCPPFFLHFLSLFLFPAFLQFQPFWSLFPPQGYLFALPPSAPPAPALLSHPCGSPSCYISPGLCWDRRLTQTSPSHILCKQCGKQAFPEHGTVHPKRWIYSNSHTEGNSHPQQLQFYHPPVPQLPSCHKQQSLTSRYITLWPVSWSPLSRHWFLWSSMSSYFPGIFVQNFFTVRGRIIGLTEGKMQRKTNRLTEPCLDNTYKKYMIKIFQASLYFSSAFFDTSSKWRNLSFMFSSAYVSVVHVFVWLFWPCKSFLSW